MSKLKKVLLMCTAYVLVIALAVGGTVAYLQDSDSDVNVMTMGNVSIAQHEYERGVNDDGTYETVTTNRGTGYKLVEFTQAKPLLPAVGTVTGWDSTRVFYEQFGEGHELGAMDVLAGLENVQDKFVFVENTGKTDAYIRTIIAYEVGSDTDAFGDLIMTNSHAFWDHNDIGVAEIDGNNYYLVEYVYSGAEGENGRHPDGIVHPGDYTYNNLAQVYMTSKATNEDVEAIDGNKNGTYDILVASQAVQADGFENAEAALDEGFYDVTTIQHPWNDGISNAKLPGYVYTHEELAAALTKGGDIKLGANISLSADDYMSITSKGHQRRLLVQDVTATLDLNGHTITVDGGGYTIYVNGDANFTVKDSVGTGVIISNSDDRMMGINGNAYVTIENGTFKNTRTEVCGYNGFSTWGNSTLKIYGGTFDIPSAGNGDGSGLQWLLHNYNGRYEGSTIGIEVFGGKFVNHDLSKGTAGTNYYGDKADLVNPAYKCVKTGVDENGNTWYEVILK